METLPRYYVGPRQSKDCKKSYICKEKTILNPLIFNTDDLMYIDNCQGQSSPRVINGARGTQSLVFCVVFCRSLHSLSPFLAWSLYFLFFIEL